MKIAVIGSINIDMSVSTNRYPRNGETMRGETISYVPGGKGANQAVAIAKLGGDVTMFGCVGQDPYGQMMIDNMRNYGVETKYIKALEGVSTGIAVITVANGDNTIIVIGGANDCVSIDYIKEVEDTLATYDFIVLQYEIPLDTVKYIIDFAYERKIKVILNPAPAAILPEEYFDKVNYFTPNEHEAEAMFKEPLEDALRRYPEKLIVTLGEKGVATSLKNGEIVNIPSRKTSVVDTTGAGDTLNGAFTYQLSLGKDLLTALNYANLAASLSIEKYGAQSGMPTKEEVESLL